MCKSGPARQRGLSAPLTKRNTRWTVDRINSNSAGTSRADGLVTRCRGTVLSGVRALLTNKSAELIEWLVYGMNSSRDVTVSYVL